VIRDKRTEDFGLELERKEEEGRYVGLGLKMV
jgi:hypothetical protein